MSPSASASAALRAARSSSAASVHELRISRTSSRTAVRAAAPSGDDAPASGCTCTWISIFTKASNGWGTGGDLPAAGGSSASQGERRVRDVVWYSHVATGAHMDPIVFLFVWVWTASLGAAVGNNRGQLLAGFVYTLMWGPLGLVAAATMPLSPSEAKRRAKVRAEAEEAVEAERRAARKPESAPIVG